MFRKLQVSRALMGLPFTTGCTYIESPPQKQHQSNLSAHQQLYGTFKFNRTPLAPPGTKALYMKHRKQENRAPCTENKVGTLSHH